MPVLVAMNGFWEAFTNNDNIDNINNIDVDINNIVFLTAKPPQTSGKLINQLM